jgi:competence ComEA-like helix-hairpin-helix protein
MSLDKRYPAFLFILALFLGFFLYTSNAFHKEPPAAPPGGFFMKPGKSGAPQIQQIKSSLPVFPIDINKASVHDLTLLPGIGEKTARRIVEKRAELKGFRSVEELTEFKWIGKAKLDKIRDLVTAGERLDGKSAPPR